MDTKSRNTGRLVMYYPEFYCDLNYIEYFQYDGKSWTRRHCKYTLDGLKEDISYALSQAKGSIISEQYKSCLKKMDLYRENVQYGTGEQKKLTSHKKIWRVNDDR